MRGRGWLAGLGLAMVVLAAVNGLGQAEWQSLFDGKTQTGWRRMAVHGGNGGIWTVEKGALVADQEPDHKGGLLGTEATYGDFEIELEFKVDKPADTGLFLRTRPDGMGYQITIDHHDQGMIGSLYAPGEGGFLQQNREWRRAFHIGNWNRLRARITGQPAHVEAWLNGAKMTDFQDHRERFPREGVIGLQVHGGAGSWGETSRARYRNIRLRRL